jgi:uncharacterized protein YabN with tetrapyrrole methylase and pyrophosphatase domain
MQKNLDYKPRAEVCGCEDGNYIKREKIKQVNRIGAAVFRLVCIDRLSAIQRQKAMNYRLNHFTTRSASIMPPIR